MIPDTRLTPTRREIQVLRLIAYGFSNKEIALRLDIAECTVKNHLLNMFQRLGFCNRVHAVVIALKQGWIALSEIEEVTLGRVAEFSESFPKRTVETFSKAAVRGMHSSKKKAEPHRRSTRHAAVEALAEN